MKTIKNNEKQAVEDADQRRAAQLVLCDPSAELEAKPQAEAAATANDVKPTIAATTAVHVDEVGVPVAATRDTQHGLQGVIAAAERARADKIRAAIKEIGGDKVTYMINTHFHGDHSGGNEEFGEDGATIVAHDNVRKRLSEGSVRRGGEKVPPSPEVAWPIITSNLSSSIPSVINMTNDDDVERDDD